MSRPTCKTCEFFMVLNNECHRNPPVVVALPNQVVSVFAPTQPSNWCGEHKPVAAEMQIVDLTPTAQRQS